MSLLGFPLLRSIDVHDGEELFRAGGEKTAGGMLHRAGGEEAPGPAEPLGHGER